ncbi:MAG: hypothetical protein AAF974_02205 [Cyanobacteria bacterium P01_E01_bin.34]
MVAKSQAIQFAVGLGWTKADAERAYNSTGIDLKSIGDGDKLPLAMALADFAGEVLYERQRLQAAQKSQVTRKKNELKQIRIDYAAKIEQFHEERDAERSVLVGMIGRLYAIGRRFGLNDPWVETLLEQYQEYNLEAESRQAS